VTFDRECSRNLPVSSPDLDWSLPEWLVECPLALEVFERRGLDYSCGGKSLDYACRERGLDPNQVLEELRVLSHAPPPDRPAVTQAPPGGA
jgi:iron-sulfur cluster repair protein YtfE (RIC family)